MKLKLQVAVLAGAVALFLTYLTRSVTFITNPLVVIPAVCVAASVYIQTKAKTNNKVLVALVAVLVSFGLTKLAERIIGMFNPSSSAWSAIGPEFVYGFIVTFMAVTLVLTLSSKLKLRS